MKIVIFDLDDTLFDTTGQLDETYANMENIKPFEGAKKILSSNGFKKILVSRGNIEIQNEKIDVLGIREFFDEIFICSTKEEKKMYFERIFQIYKVKDGMDIVVVGNRIDEEIRYGKLAGFKTVLLKHGKYKNMKATSELEIPDHKIKKLSELLEIVK